MRWLLVGVVLAAGAGCSGDPVEPACGAAFVRCDGDVLVTCAGGVEVRRDCAADQLVCGRVDGVDGTACVSAICATIGLLGRCDGAILTRCEDGLARETECSAGQVCAYLDDTTGFACRAMPEPASVSGRITYEDRPPDGHGRLGPVQVLPARGVTVLVVEDSSRAILATVVAGDDGAYVAPYAVSPGSAVHVTAIARSTTPGRPVTVTDDDNAVHGLGSPSFSAPTQAQDVLITVASGEAQAFNVFDQLVRVMDTITAELAPVPPRALAARWSRGNNVGTFYGDGTIWVLGIAADDDGFDDTVILHETGHFVEDALGRTDNPGGNHNGAPTDPRLAWSEGFATAWGQSVAGYPAYQDSNAGGGFVDDVDGTVTVASGVGLDQQVSERLVSQILWDLGDAGAADDDPVTTASTVDVHQVQPGYLRGAVLRAIGATGVDLVDFLDGWFLLHGLSTCAAVREVVTVRHGFPYDFGGPGGPCPSS
jgi:hypothetical protein